MALATLSIDLVAKLAKFEEDLGKAVRISEKQAAAIDKVFSRIGQGVAGLGIAAAISTQIDRDKLAIDRLDGLDDLSEKYGIAASKLSEYGYASEVAGTSTEAFADGLNKLAKNMAAAAGGSAQQIAAFKAIGVEVKNTDGTLRSADEVLLDVADRFASYEDGASKAALAQVLFGKSGAELIPVLNRGRDGIRELADEGKRLGAVFGDDAAKKAAEFNDNLKKIELASQGLYAQIASSLLPTLINVTNQLIEGRKAYGSFVSALIDVGFNTDPMKSLEENITLTVQQLARQRADLAEMLARGDRIEKGEGSLADRFNDIGGDTQRARMKEAIALLEKRLTYLQKMRALQGGGDVPSFGEAGGGKPDAPTVNTKAAAELAAAEKSYQRLIEAVKERGALAKKELENNGQLSEADRLRETTLAKLNLEINKYTPQMKKEGEAEVERVAVLLEQVAAREQLRKAAEAAAAAEQANIRAVEEAIEGRRGENNALREQIALFGMTAEQIEQVRIRRLQETLAVEQGEIAIARAQGAGAGELIVMQQKARLLEQQIELRQRVAAQQSAQDRDPMLGASKAVTDYLENISKAGEATRQAVTNSITTLENDLTQSLVSQKPSIRGFVDTVIAEMYRLTVVRPLLKNIFGADGAGGLFGSFFKALGGGGGGSGGAGLIAELTEYGVFAKGGAFDIAGARPFAAGGVFDSPHFFKFAQGSAMQTGVMGEAGPEAIMPLRRGADGKLGVVAQGGGRSVVLAPSIAIHIDSRTDAAAVRQEVAQGVQAGMQAVMEQLHVEGVR